MSKTDSTGTRKTVLVLVTKLGMNRDQVQNQQRALTMLEAKNIPYETIDGSDPENKEARNELFRLSGLRAVYPQFFLIHGQDRLEFLGDWEKIEALNDASGLPDEVLEGNPGIMTWENVLS